MKSIVRLVVSLSLAGLLALTGCTPQVRIEEAPPTSIATRPTAPATAPSTAGTTMPGQTTRPSLPTQSQPSAATSATSAPQPGSPEIVVESDEIVPIPPHLMADLNTALDDLINSIDNLEELDEDVIALP